MVYAGTLRDKLTFYEVVETQSESGYKHTEEVKRFTVRAYRKKNKESYGVDAEELFHTSELTFLLRYRKEIKETDIVVYEGERYRITSLSPYLKDDELTIILSKIND